MVASHRHDKKVIFDFQVFLIIFNHAKACTACIHWSKYTTFVFICQLFKRSGCLAFRCHLNTKPFVIQPLFDHSNFELVWYSDPHCSAYISFKFDRHRNMRMIPVVKLVVEVVKYMLTL